jgi:AcrR family transcriptional regulator
MIESVQLFSLHEFMLMTVISPTDTRERILDAGEEAVRRFGLRRVSMAEVAELARVSRGSVYRYFPDRNTLVAAVLRRTAERFVESSAASIRRRRTLATQVGEAAVFIREHIRDDSLTLPAHGVDNALLATLLAAHVDGLVTEWVEFWQPLLAEAVERGEIRAGLDHREVAEWIVRIMLSFAVMPSVVIDLGDPAAVRRFVQDHIVRGLAPEV